MFKNRHDAAKQLADKFMGYESEQGVVLGIPRGGVPMAAIIAKRLDWPMGLILSKKISHPVQKEFAIGAVSMTSRVINDAIEVTPEYIDEETHRVREKLREQYRWYFKNRPVMSYTDKVVIIVDDGMATGYTMLTTLDLIEQHKPSAIIVAVPVTSKSAIRLIEESPGKHQVVTLLADGSFFSVGQYYEEFTQVTDDEVQFIVTNSRQNAA